MTSGRPSSTRKIETLPKRPQQLTLAERTNYGMNRTVPKSATVVTYSELDTYRQCPLKHQWSYIDRWREEPKEGSALARGSLWHAVMETHYWLIKIYPKISPEALLQFALQYWLTDPNSGSQTDDQVLITWMYEGYLENYGKDLDWKLVAIEQAGRVPLPNPSGGRSRFHLQFKVDLIVADTRGVWLVDHKSARDFSRQTEIDIDDQFGLYSWALMQLGLPVIGTIRSDARTQRNKGPMELDNRFRRVPTFRTTKELENLALDAYQSAQAAYSKNTPVHSSPAPDRCSWRCSYLNQHLLIRKGFDVELTMKDFGFAQSAEKHREYGESSVVTALRDGRIKPA